MHTHHHLVKGHAAFVCAIEIPMLIYTFDDWILVVVGGRNTSFGFAYLSHAGSAPQLNLWEHLCHLFVCVMCMFLLSLSLSLLNANASMHMLCTTLIYMDLLH